MRRRLLDSAVDRVGAGREGGTGYTMSPAASEGRLDVRSGDAPVDVPEHVHHGCGYGR